LGAQVTDGQKKCHCGEEEPNGQYAEFSCHHPGDSIPFSQPCKSKKLILKGQKAAQAADGGNSAYCTDDFNRYLS
jgi:hypothetical protein